MKQKPTIHAPKSVWRNPIHFLAYGFGSGAIPVASGTFGTLAAIPIYLLMQDLSLAYYLLILALITLVGVPLCHITARDMGVHDHPGIVWDEIAGYLLTMVAAPKGWLWIWLGFGLFRLFDIWKPWPIRWLDRQVHGGLGIMVDDTLAAIYALICLQVLALYLP